MLRERQFGILLTRSGLHLAVILPFTSSMVNFIHKKSHFIQLHKKCAPPQKFYLGLSEIRSCNFSNNKFCHRCFLRKLAGFKTIVLLEKGLNYWHFDCDFLKMQAATWLKLEIFLFCFFTSDFIKNWPHVSILHWIFPNWKMQCNLKYNPSTMFSRKTSKIAVKYLEACNKYNVPPQGSSLKT